MFVLQAKLTRNDTKNLRLAMMHNLIKFNFLFNCFVSHGYYYSNVAENLSLLFCPAETF